MTDQQHLRRFDDAMAYRVKAIMGATIPNPYTAITAERRGKCEECGDWSLWAPLNEPLLCAYHTALATYRNLPWWRRALTQKPRP